MHNITNIYGFKRLGQIVNYNSEENQNPVEEKSNCDYSRRFFSSLTVKQHDREAMTELTEFKWTIAEVLAPFDLRLLMISAKMLKHKGADFPFKSEPVPVGRKLSH